MALVACTLFGCASSEKPPEFGEAEAYFMSHRNDIRTMTDFLLEQDEVYIISSEHSIDNWKDTPLNKEIIEAMKRLRGNQSQQLIKKSGNTIIITIFFPKVREISSGFAYSINGADTPCVEYAIEMTPLSEPGWYYFVEDFNSWRANS